jgi:predicted DNA-binding transcriptional regulator AlpA
MSRDEAARYIGVGNTKFDEMVADGRMPRPKRVDGRVIWDKGPLDEVRRRRRPKGVAVIIEIDEDLGFENLMVRCVTPGRLARPAIERDAAWRGDALDPRRDVDAIAKDVVAFDDDVADIDPDTELDRISLGAKSSMNAGRNALPAAMVSMPHSRISFTSRSCSVPLARSTRPLACEELAQMMSMFSACRARPNWVMPSPPTASSC